MTDEIALPVLPESIPEVKPELDDILKRLRRAALSERRLRARAKKIGKEYLEIHQALKLAEQETLEARTLLETNLR